MIVLGADTHKRSDTIAAVSTATGEVVGEQTVQVGAKGFAAVVVWARELGSERVWALEDCRHVSGSLERFLIERGERVVRVTTKLTADSRRRARGRAKSDSIDAIAVARAALREGLDALPAAQLERLSDELCVRPRRHVGGQPGNRSPKWILRAWRGAVQVRLRCHLASAFMIAR
jgi:transposase